MRIIINVTASQPPQIGKPASDYRPLEVCHDIIPTRFFTVHH
jgi:hypothetical protein